MTHPLKGLAATESSTAGHQQATAERPPDPLRLTPQQEAIVRQVVTDVADPSVFTIGVFGGAGTGKTTLTGAFVRDLQAIHGDGVVLCATTHKAARQVERAMAQQGVPSPSCITIHRLLGVRQVRNKSTGEEYFAPDKHHPPVLDDHIRVVVLDETSMLSEQLYGLLMDAAGIFQTIIFVGDERQIPPVSDGKLCPAFTEAAR